MKRKKCFVVTLKDGKIMELGKHCNKVDYESEKMCVFKHEEGKSYTVLAIIPYENIKTIEQIETWDCGG